MNISKEMVLAWGYEHPIFKGGCWHALMPLTFGEWRVCSDIQMYGHNVYYDYASRQEAIAAMQIWNGIGRPSGNILRANKQA